MKILLSALFLLTTLTALAEPTWVPKGTPVPAGLYRTGALPMTGSMRPALHGGEHLIVEKITSATVLRVGDIISVTTHSGPRTHRITALNERAVYTSGDACRKSDGWSDRSAVVFVVRFVERP